jgi:hypothetical protein
MRPPGGPHCHDISVKVQFTECGVCALNEYQFKSTLCPYFIYFIWKREGKPRGKYHENGSWSNGTYVRGWTVFSSCKIRVKGRGFLNVVLKVKAENFLTNLATVSVQWSYCTTANCTVVVLFGLTTALFVLHFQYHVTLLWQSPPPQQPPKVVCFCRLIRF